MLTYSSDTNSNLCDLFPQISQISCFDNTGLAPSGCTQYYTGTSGKIQSFNWMTNGANSVQLANQNQKICFRYFDRDNLGFKVRSPRLEAVGST